MYLQHYADRTLRALKALGGAATPFEVAHYMTANGHRITPKRAQRYLEVLALGKDWNATRGERYYA